MRKTGVFGGTFDPPHKGHRLLAECMAKELRLDRVIIIPTCIPPHKQANPVSGEDRMKMCRLTFDSPLFEISDMELKRGDKSYTVDTLRILHEEFPDDELYFLSGSDMFETFTLWYRWEEILSLSYFCSAARVNGYEPDFSRFTPEQKEKVRFIYTEPFEISSSEIRAAVSSGKDCSKYLSSGTYEYIKQNRLYYDGLSEFRKVIERNLDKRRIYHSECVCESAGILAKKYGWDVKKARLAGLMHDITKNLPGEEQLRLIGEMTQVERSNSKVWHQMSAPVYLKENGLIDDEEILCAIRWHTTGRAAMTLPEKIVYVADFISADRDYPDVDTVRKLADISLEHAILYTSRYTVRSLAAKDRPVHPATLDCYNDTLIYFGGNK